jgi:hypothetical protein
LKRGRCSIHVDVRQAGRACLVSGVAELYESQN